MRNALLSIIRNPLLRYGTRIFIKNAIYESYYILSLNITNKDVVSYYVLPQCIEESFFSIYHSCVYLVHSSLVSGRLPFKIDTNETKFHNRKLSLEKVKSINEISNDDVYFNSMATYIFLNHDRHIRVYRTTNMVIDYELPNDSHGMFKVTDEEKKMDLILQARKLAMSSLYDTTSKYKASLLSKNCTIEELLNKKTQGKKEKSIVRCALLSRKIEDMRQYIPNIYAKLVTSERWIGDKSLMFDSKDPIKQK